MHAAGSHAHQHVTHLDLGAVDQLRLLHDARGVAGDVIFAVLIHARHFGRLAAHEGAARLAATFRHAGDDGLHLGGDIVSQRDVVQENERFGPLGEDVVDAHRHGVNADGVVLVHRKGDLEFRANAVGAADKDRFIDIQSGKVEHAAEGADVSHRSDALRGCDVLLDPADHFIPRLKVHAGVFISLGHIASR